MCINTLREFSIFSGIDMFESPRFTSVQRKFNLRSTLSRSRGGMPRRWNTPFLGTGEARTRDKVRALRCQFVLPITFGQPEESVIFRTWKSRAPRSMSTAKFTELIVRSTSSTWRCRGWHTAKKFECRYSVEKGRAYEGKIA